MGGLVAVSPVLMINLSDPRIEFSLLMCAYHHYSICSINKSAVATVQVK